MLFSPSPNQAQRNKTRKTDRKIIIVFGRSQTMANFEILIRICLILKPTRSQWNHLQLSVREQPNQQKPLHVYVKTRAMIRFAHLTAHAYINNSVRSALFRCGLTSRADWPSWALELWLFALTKIQRIPSPLVGIETAQCCIKNSRLILGGKVQVAKRNAFFNNSS